MLLRNLDINVYDKNGLKILYTYPVMSVSGFQVSTRPIMVMENHFNNIIISSIIITIKKLNLTKVIKILIFKDNEV